MARFQVYRTTDGRGWLMDVQSDLMTHLNTRVVVPLMRPEAAPKPATRLNPVFMIGAARVVMVTQFLSAVPVTVLRDPVTTLADRADEVTAALDMMTVGL